MRAHLLGVGAAGRLLQAEAGLVDVRLGVCRRGQQGAALGAGNGACWVEVKQSRAVRKLQSTGAAGGDTRRVRVQHAPSPLLRRARTWSSCGAHSERYKH
jgi:hypothetical protein